MTHVTRWLISALSFAVAIAFSSVLSHAQAPGAAKKMEFDSPLLKPWTGPYGGVPPWNLVRSEDFIPAFDAAIKASNADIKAITDDPEPADFDNTIVTMNVQGMLNRLNAIFLSMPRISMSGQSQTSRKLSFQNSPNTKTAFTRTRSCLTAFLLSTTVRP